MPITLLLADDSVVIQKLVGLSFANEDIKIITVDNGDDAISRANECKPDIVLADVVMPGKNGYEVCSAIRKNPELAGTPVLLLTGTFEAFDEGRANEVGATGHVTKPFEAQVLVDRVTELLEQSRGTAQASPSLAGTGDFFDESPGEMGGTASTIPRPAEPSIGESFAFGTNMTNDSLNMGIDMANEPLSSPVDEVGAETAALVAGTDLSDLLDGAGGDRTVAIMPEGLGSDPTPNSPPEDLGSSPADLPANDPGQTLLVDDFLDRPGADSDPFGSTSLQNTADDATGTAIGSVTLTGMVAPTPMNALSLPSTPLDVNDDSLGLDGLSFATQPTGQAPDIAAPAGDETVLAEDLFADGPDLESSLDEVLSGPAVSSLPASPGLDIDFAGTPRVEKVGGEALGGDDASAANSESELLAADSSWGAKVPAGVQTAPEPISMTFDTRENPTPPALEQQPGVAVARDTSASRQPHITTEMGERIHDTLEKVAWEAFSDLSDTVVSQLMKRVEQIAWEVIPQMAETLIREEIRRMKAGEGGEGGEDKE